MPVMMCSCSYVCVREGRREVYYVDSGSEMV